MKTTGTLSALAAARKVLAAAGKPLHYQEITRRILAARLWRTAGKTPDATHAELVRISTTVSVARTRHNAFLKELGLPILPPDD